VELLGGAGYARLTMDQVAARARVSESSLYLRWPNKVAPVADALQHRARAVPEVPDTGTLPGDVRAFLAALLRSRHEASRALAAVSGEIATNPELREAWHRGLASMLTGCLRLIVDRAVAHGELAADSDMELLSQLPLSLTPRSYRPAVDGGSGVPVSGLPFSSWPGRAARSVPAGGHRYREPGRRQAGIGGIGCAFVAQGATDDA
jgi:AcrR family transcriptional regulator